MPNVRWSTPTRTAGTGNNLQLPLSLGLESAGWTKSYLRHFSRLFSSLLVDMTGGGGDQGVVSVFVSAVNHYQTNQTIISIEYGTI